MVLISRNNGNKEGARMKRLFILKWKSHFEMPGPKSVKFAVAFDLSISC